MINLGRLTDFERGKVAIHVSTRLYFIEAEQKIQIIIPISFLCRMVIYANEYACDKKGDIA